MQMRKQQSYLLVALFIVLLSPCFSFNLFNRVDLPVKSGAACLDGSLPAFYVWVPDDLDKPVNKVLIYF